MDATNLPICPYCFLETNDNEVPVGFEYDTFYTITCEHCGKKFQAYTVKTLEYKSYTLEGD